MHLLTGQAGIDPHTVLIPNRSFRPTLQVTANGVSLRDSGGSGCIGYAESGLQLLRMVGWRRLFLRLRERGLNQLRPFRVHVGS